MKTFYGTLPKREQKSLKKHYVYKGPALRFTCTSKPYKTLVKQLLREYGIAVRKPL